MPKQADACWVITDHAAGNQRQALALASELGLETFHMQLEPRAPWSWLAPRLSTAGRYALSREQRRLFTSPWPRVAIGCGRQAALFTRMLRRLSADTSYTVQILDPRMASRHWHTVIAPRHDRLDGVNVLSPLGSLNPVNTPWLADAQRAWPQLGQLPAPRVGVLLGGPRRGMALGPRYAHELAGRLQARQQVRGGSLLIVASGRTPGAWSAPFREILRNLPGLCWHGDADGPNPYAGVLGCSDALVVTPDSVNMLSEACAVGCPVHTFVTAPLPTRLARFHQALRSGRWLHDVDDPPAVGQVAPLRETAAIAAIVRDRMAMHAVHA